MHISEKLIRDFLNGNCSDEEKQFVTAWLRNNPDQLEKYLTEESWDAFLPREKSLEVSERMLKNINEAIDKKIIRITRFRWVAAASAILIISASFFYALNKKTNNSALATISTQEKKDIPALAFVKNDLATDRKISLPDGSIVTLSAGSSISYHNPFIENRRDIYLNGEANFKVAKDSTKPFCVHSKSINTTALGTMFKVNEKNPKLISIKLFEGKVVIRNDNKAAQMKDVYLTPGHELTFNNQNFSVAVQLITTAIPKHKTNDIQKTIPAITLQFENKPLQEIFEELQKIYHTEIKYKTADIKDMNFTGTHKTNTETLEEFLNTIATLNDLTIKKTNDGYTVIQAK